MSATLTNGISALTKETRELTHFLMCVDPGKRCLSGNQEPDSESAGTLILDFQPPEF